MALSKSEFRGCRDYRQDTQPSQGLSAAGGWAEGEGYGPPRGLVSGWCHGD